MAQAQTDGLMSMVDPFGFWKTYRDASLEGWSKFAIDMVNTQEYAQFTGTLLDQYMSMAQPVQDAVQKSMVMLLPYFNLPSRDEVISVAERLVHIETRLDDLDAQTSDASDEHSKELRSVDRSLDKVLNTILARLDDLEAAITPERKKPEAKPESKSGTAK